MSITINAGPDKQINLSGLKDLEHKALTTFNVGKELSTHFGKPLSQIPDSVTASIQYDSGNQKWNLDVVAFKLSGGVTGQIAVMKSGKLYDYTDKFPTQIQLGLDTGDNSDSSASFSLDPGAIYVMVELDFCIESGVSITSAPTSFGLSGSVTAGTSDTFQVAFYRKCAPTDLLEDALAQAFKNLVLPFHSQTLQNLQPGDILRHTAGANLQLGLGAGIGFDSFSVANQWSSGIPKVPNSPKLNIGINPTVSPAITLAYNFSYAGTFEQTLWRESATSARLHIYRSTQKVHGLDFTAGITLDVNLDAELEVKKQILNAPKNATSDPNLQAALGTAFNAASGAIDALAKEVNSRITKLLKPVNQDLSVYLDAGITSTNQTFLLTDYTIDLTKNYTAAWNDMINGKFVDSLAHGNGSVQLAVGSGLEKLYSRTASIGLNFFGQWAAQWSESSIANSSLIYAGNNTFHLITAEGRQRISKLEASSTEIDFYFSTELDLSGAGTAAQARPNLNAILKATNNGAFGARIATVVGWLTSGPGSQDLRNQILTSVNTGQSTQVLHIIIPEESYRQLGYSPSGSPPPQDQLDRRNYAAFAKASKITMPAGTMAQFACNNHELDYNVWRIWNIALTDQYPPPAGSQTDRKTGSGSFQGSGVTQYLHQLCGISAPLFSIGVTLQAASEFMNLCEDLVLLSGDNPVTIDTWNDFVDRLLNIANRDVNLDYIVPTVLAITQLCGTGIPKTTIGPAPGLSADTSIGVTMAFS